MSFLKRIGAELTAGGADAAAPGIHRLGRLAAGSAMASANLATQVLHMGVRGGARAADSIAGSVGKVVPGARLVQKLAQTLDDEAGRGEEAASERVSRCLDWMKTEYPKFQNQAATNGSITNDPETNGPTANGRLTNVGASSTSDGNLSSHDALSFTELAADTAFGPLEALFGTSVTLGGESIRETLTSRVGQLALDAGLERLQSPIEASSGLVERSALRESFVAVASDSGAGALRETLALAEAAARLAFSDTRKMRRTVGEGLEEMRRLVASAEMQDLLPTPVVSESVRTRARWIVERAPSRFLEALGTGADGQAPGWSAILRATVEDADNLRIFAVVYPQVVVLIGTDVGKLLLAGAISFAEMEAFMEGRRHGDNEVSSNFT